MSRGADKSKLKPSGGNFPAGNSKPVSSSQHDIHPRLPELLQRHRQQPWQQPLHSPTVRAWETLLQLLGPDERSGLVLDSGCGTGDSTFALARQHPHRVVVGIDRSRSRLAKFGADSGPIRKGNCVLLRAELETFWRLALAEQWRLSVHYLLYPNPWPKAAQVQRRWHAHPVFPVLMKLGGEIILRTNWLIYAREFAFAAAQFGGGAPDLEPLLVQQALSPFERKYRASGHQLFEVRVPDANPGCGTETLGNRLA